MNHPAAPRLDGFEFLDYLGGGAFGQVWKALDVKMNVLRAVKVLPRERFREEHARMLLEEAQTLAHLPKHRNRMAVHYFKEGVTNSFLVMDYVPGGALSRQTSPGRPLPWARAIRYVSGVGDALLDVHARGLLHRDINPDNIMWDPEPDEAVLGDVGIAVAVGPAAGCGGTRGYVAPEAYRGAAAAKSDVFSLAASLLHLVTGLPPREHAPPAEHPGWASLSEDLRQVLLSGLDPDPARRADLPTFLCRLRKARWKALTDRMTANMPEAASVVKLQASVAVAGADRPDAFRPLQKDGLRVPARTGDFVKVEAQANADGYLTVLVLESSGDVQVGLPHPTEPENRFRAGQRCSLIFRLTPPDGVERVLVHWSAQGERRTPSQWRQWLDAGLAPGEAEMDHPGLAVRGAEVLRMNKGPAPEGNSRVLVIPVPHVAPA